MNYSIRFENVSKRYRMGYRLPTWRDILGGGGNADEESSYWALRDFSFELQPGEALAIVGPNGAGKTTTLKLLANVTKPSSGNIHVNGRFSALIELGAGFHPDLTGRENVFLNGTILGMKRAEIKSRFDQIVDFAGIEEYLDTPIKRYSSGMIARLGFAVAAHVDPEILLVDEVLAVGDYAFRMKCYERMDELRRQGTSLIFVSHNMEDVRRVCDRGIVLYAGQKAFEGTSAEAVAEYGNVLRRNASKSARSNGSGSSGLAQRSMTHGAQIKEVKLIGSEGSPQTSVFSGSQATVSVEIEFHEDAPSPIFAVAITDEQGNTVYDVTTKLLQIDTPEFRKGESAVVNFALNMHLLGGTYKVRADLAYQDLSCYYDYVEDALTFTVVDENAAKGIADLGATVEFASVPSEEAVTSDHAEAELSAPLQVNS